MKREEAPLSMRISLGMLALGQILLGLFNERIVAGIIRPAVPFPF